MALTKTETEVTKDDGCSKDSYLEMGEIMVWADRNCMLNTLPHFSLPNNEFISLFLSRAVTRHPPIAWPASVAAAGEERKNYFLSNQIAVLNLPGRLSNSQRPGIFYFSVLLASKVITFPTGL